MSSVQSVARAFTILQAIAAEPEGLSLTEIAQQVELPKSTVSRLLATMERFKVIERRPNTGGIHIGEGIVSMAMQMPYRRSLTIVAHPIMQRLANEIGEAVGLCVPDGDQVHYVDQVQSHYHVQVRDWTGSRFPMHTVSAGKLFMSEWEPAVLYRYLSGPLAQFTPHTHNTPDALRDQLITIRETGVSWAIDEFEVGLTAVSAPVREATQQLIAAVNIYGPGFRFPGEKSQAEINEQVIAASSLISERLQRLQ